MVLNRDTVCLNLLLAYNQSIEAWTARFKRAKRRPLSSPEVAVPFGQRHGSRSMELAMAKWIAASGDENERRQSRREEHQ